MANIVVRRFEERDREGFNRVRSMSYRGGGAVRPDEDILRGDLTGYVADRDGQIPGAFTAIDMTATRGRTTYRCSGICAVGVLPEERRSGVGAALMTDSLRLMRDEGYHLASLHAYRETYYRKFGYECCGSSYDIRCPLERLPKVRTNLPVRQLRPDEFESIRPCYREFAQRYSGMNTREHEGFWPNTEGEPPTVYAAGDPVEAYVIARLDSTFWNDQAIREFVWTSPEGYRACLALLHGYAINKNAIRWSEPGDSPFLAIHFDQGMEVKAERPAMYRILDLPACLEALPAGRDGAFTLKLIDPQMPENSGPWRVECGGGRVKVSPKAGKPDIELDVKQMAQALLGEPSLADLVRLGLAEAVRGEALETALALLPPNPTTCLDQF